MEANNANPAAVRLALANKAWAEAHQDAVSLRMERDELLLKVYELENVWWRKAWKWLTGP